MQNAYIEFTIKVVICDLKNCYIRIYDNSQVGRHTMKKILSFLLTLIAIQATGQDTLWKYHNDSVFKQLNSYWSETCKEFSSNKTSTKKQYKKDSKLIKLCNRLYGLNLGMAELKKGLSRLGQYNLTTKADSINSEFRIDTRSDGNLIFFAYGKHRDDKILELSFHLQTRTRFMCRNPNQESLQMFNFFYFEKFRPIINFPIDLKSYSIELVVKAKSKS